MLASLVLFTDGTPLSAGGAKSFTELELQCSAMNQRYVLEFQEHCIEYVREWFIVVKSRLDMSVEKAVEMEKQWKHYERKVKQLTGAEAKLCSRGKPSDKKLADKLQRNKEKHDVAKMEFEKFAPRVCNLIDAAVDGAWRDTTPLVYHLTRMAHDRRGTSGSESSEALTESFAVLIARLQKFADENNIELEPPMPPADDCEGKSAKTTPKRWFSK